MAVCLVPFLFRRVVLYFPNVLYFFFSWWEQGSWGQKREGTKPVCFIQDRSTQRFLPQHKGFLGLCWGCGYACVISSVLSLKFITFSLGWSLVTSAVFLFSVLTLYAIMIFHMDCVFMIWNFLCHCIFFIYLAFWYCGRVFSSQLQFLLHWMIY